MSQTGEIDLNESLFDILKLLNTELHSQASQIFMKLDGNTLNLVIEERTIETQAMNNMACELSSILAEQNMTSPIKTGFDMINENKNHELMPPFCLLNEDSCERSLDKLDARLRKLENLRNPHALRKMNTEYIGKSLSLKKQASLITLIRKFSNYGEERSQDREPNKVIKSSSCEILTLPTMDLTITPTSFNQGGAQKESEILLNTIADFTLSRTNSKNDDPNNEENFKDENSKGEDKNDEIKIVEKGELIQIVEGCHNKLEKVDIDLAFEDLEEVNSCYMGEATKKQENPRNNFEEEHSQTPKPNNIELDNLLLHQNPSEIKKEDWQKIINNIKQREEAVRELEMYYNNLQRENSLSSAATNTITQWSFDSKSTATLYGGDPLKAMLEEQMQESYGKNILEIEKAKQQDPSIYFLFLYSAPLITYEFAEGARKKRPVSNDINYSNELSSIKEVFSGSGREIRFMSCNAVLEKFGSSLDRNPSAIHFCGHGIKNAKENMPYHTRDNEGDFLIFEDQNGAAYNVSCKQISKLVKKLKNKLDFVFVASCHSQLVGEVFKEAGATHVICVRRNERILDKACQIFTNAFYNSCLAGKKTICEAFEIAKEQVRAEQNLPRGEENKFLLLINDDNEQSYYGHTCSGWKDCGPGRLLDFSPKVDYDRLPSKVEHFLGRNCEMHELINLIINQRFVTVKGIPGIGKSSILKEISHYCLDRQYFRNGILYLQIGECDTVEAIVSMLETLISNRGIQVESKKENSSGKLYQIINCLRQKEVLVIFDNCDRIILSNEKIKFKPFLEYLLDRCNRIKILLSSRAPMGGEIGGCAEKIITLNNLSDEDCKNLLLRKAPRTISSKEIEELWELTTIEKGYERKQDLHSHSLFELFGGHPQATTLAAALLDETRSLKELYEYLTKQPMIEALGAHQDYTDTERKSFNSLKISLDVSWDALRTRHQEASKFFSLLGLIPAGGTEEDFDKIYGKGWTDLRDILVRSSLLLKSEKDKTTMYKLYPFMTKYAEEHLTKKEKMYFHCKIVNHVCKKFESIFQKVATLSSDAIEKTLEFLRIEINIRAIIFRELSFVGKEDLEKSLYKSLSLISMENYNFKDKHHHSNGLDNQQEGFNDEENGRMVELTKANLDMYLKPDKKRLDVIKGSESSSIRSSSPINNRETFGKLISSPNKSNNNKEKQGAINNVAARNSLDNSCKQKQQMDGSGFVLSNKSSVSMNNDEDQTGVVGFNRANFGMPFFILKEEGTEPVDKPHDTNGSFRKKDPACSKGSQKDSIETPNFTINSSNTHESRGGGNHSEPPGFPIRKASFGSNKGSSSTAAGNPAPLNEGNLIVKSPSSNSLHNQVSNNNSSIKASQPLVISKKDSSKSGSNSSTLVNKDTLGSSTETANQSSINTAKSEPPSIASPMRIVPSNAVQIPPLPTNALATAKKSGQSLKNKVKPPKTSVSPATYEKSGLDNIAKIVVFYSSILFLLRRYDECRKIITIGFQLEEGLKDLIFYGNLKRISGCLEYIKKRYNESIKEFQMAEDAFRKSSCSLGIAISSAGIGYNKLLLGELAQARQNLEGSLKIYETLNHTFGLHFINRWLANVKRKTPSMNQNWKKHIEAAKAALKNKKHECLLSKHRGGYFILRWVGDCISIFIEPVLKSDQSRQVWSRNSGLETTRSQNVGSSISSSGPKKFSNVTGVKSFENENLNQGSVEPSPASMENVSSVQIEKKQDSSELVAGNNKKDNKEKLVPGKSQIKNGLYKKNPKIPVDYYKQPCLKKKASDKSKQGKQSPIEFSTITPGAVDMTQSLPVAVAFQSPVSSTSNNISKVAIDVKSQKKDLPGGARNTITNASIARQINPAKKPSYIQKPSKKDSTKK